MLGPRCAPAADELVGEQAEPALDLVDPAGSGRGEVDMEPGMTGQPPQGSPDVEQEGLPMARRHRHHELPDLPLFELGDPIGEVAEVSGFLPLSF